MGGRGALAEWRAAGVTLESEGVGGAGDTGEVGGDQTTQTPFKDVGFTLRAAASHHWFLIRGVTW